MKRAILWDNDGVLVRTEDFYFRSTRSVMRELGSDLDRASFHRLFLQDFIDPLRQLLEERGQADAFLTHHRRRILHHRRLLKTEDLFVDGVSEAVHALAPRYVMGVVTGAKRESLQTIAARSDFYHLFRFTVTYEDVERQKPDPEPYRTGVERAGVPPEDCVVIEDSLRGMRSAKAAGLECWIVPNGLTSEADFSDADRVLDSVAEVASLLQGSLTG